MSALPDDPEHFWNWLCARPGGPLCPDPYCFVPRQTYGDYLADLIAPLRSHDETQGLTVIRGECIGIREDPSGITVTLADGIQLTDTVAILATGHDVAASHLPGHADPWASPTDAGINRDATVLILGTGLSMVDYVLSLLRTLSGTRPAPTDITRDSSHPKCAGEQGMAATTRDAEFVRFVAPPKGIAEDSKISGRPTRRPPDRMQPPRRCVPLSHQLPSWCENWQVEPTDDSSQARQEQSDGKSDQLPKIHLVHFEIRHNALGIFYGEIAFHCSLRLCYGSGHTHSETVFESRFLDLGSQVKRRVTTASQPPLQFGRRKLQNQSKRNLLSCNGPRTGFRLHQGGILGALRLGA
jgi:hypothetical protein